jgi:hypothetical protein
MFGNGMMKKMQEMQLKMEESKARLANITVNAESGGVKVVVDGNGVVKDITANPEMSQEELLDHVIIAANKALTQANQTKELEMAQSAKGILPGM